MSADNLAAAVRWVRSTDLLTPLRFLHVVEDGKARRATLLVIQAIQHGRAHTVCTDARDGLVAMHTRAMRAAEEHVAAQWDGLRAAPANNQRHEQGART